MSALYKKRNPTKIGLQPSVVVGDANSLKYVYIGWEIHRFQHVHSTQKRPQHFAQQINEVVITCSEDLCNEVLVLHKESQGSKN